MAPMTVSHTKLPTHIWKPWPNSILDKKGEVVGAREERRGEESPPGLEALMKNCEVDKNSPPNGKRYVREQGNKEAGRVRQRKPQLKAGFLF